MNRTIVAVAVVAVTLVVIVGAAFAFGNGKSDDRSAQAPTPTPAYIATQVPGQTAIAPTPTASSTAAPTATATTTIAPSRPEPATPVPAPSVPATSTPVPQSPTLEADRKAVPAPIDKLKVAALASNPEQYVAQIMAGLPDGCARPYTYSVVRNGSEIVITVLNSAPARPMACTAIYGDYPLNVNLGSDFESGTTYSVKANDRTATFTAQ